MNNSLNKFLIIAFNVFMILSYVLVLVGAVKGEISVNFALVYSAIGFIFYVVIIAVGAYIEHKINNKPRD